MANTGFKAQFSHGYRDSKGAVALQPSWVSVFNGIFSWEPILCWSSVADDEDRAGQVVGQFSVPWAAEWLGRRGAVFVVMAVLLLVYNPIIAQIKR